MRMRFHGNLSAVALVALLPLMSTTDSKARTTATSYNVISTISNGDGIVSFVLQSDNQPGNASAVGSYSTADASLASSVTSLEWLLDLSQQSLRTVYLDVSKMSPAPPVASGNYNATIFSRCYDQSGNSVSFLSIAPGTAQINCSLRINFTADGASYSLVMAPAAELPSGAPATGRASVACNSNASDGSGCTDWAITPYSGGSNPGIAALILHARNGKNTVVGSYSGDTFRVDLQR